MELREKFLKKVRERVKKEGERRDLFLSHIIKTMDDLDKVSNMLTGRLKEWYSYYFPELDIRDNEKFVKAVLAIEDKKSINEEELRKVVGEGLAQKIAKAGKESSGGDIKKEDLEYIKMLAREIEELNKLRDKYEEDLEKISNEIAPNATYIAGGKIVARLIAHAHGLDKLADLPASTIQVLGAEKALFKYLKKRSKKPPKHGMLLLHGYVNTLPKKLRGKMARTLASKLSIALKVDSEKGKFIGDKLKQELEKRYNELKQMAKEQKHQKKR